MTPDLRCLRQSRRELLPWPASAGQLRAQGPRTPGAEGLSVHPPQVHLGPWEEPGSRGLPWKESSREAAPKHNGLRSLLAKIQKSFP